MFGIILSIKMVLGGLAFVLTTFLSLPYVPLVFKALNRDAGVFLYMASEVLRGSLPYRDFWDHKGPLIYYLNALGLKIFGLWGVWLLHFIVFFFSGLLLVKVLEQKEKNRWVLGLALLSFYLQLSVLFFEFNQVEIFAILSQAIYIYLFLRKKSSFWHFVLGLLAGLSSLLRPNLIGFYLAGIVFVLLFERKDFLRNIAFQIFGFSFAWAIAFGFFWLKSGVWEFVDASLFYNFLYLKTPLSARFSALLSGFEYLNKGKTGLFLFAGFLVLFFKRRLAKVDIFLFLVFFFEFLLTLLSGRNFSHYYYPLVFPASFFVGRFFGQVEESINFQKHLWLYFLFISYFTLSFLKLSGSKLVGNYRASKESQLIRVVQFLKSKPYLKKALVWGADPSVLFLSGKSSASKYYYQYPLFTPGYGNKAYKEFLKEIKKQKPKYIVDITSYTNKVVPLNPTRRKFWRINSYYSLPQGIDKFLKFVGENYRLEKVFGDIEVYRLK